MRVATITRSILQSLSTTRRSSLAVISHSFSFRQPLHARVVSQFEFEGLLTWPDSCLHPHNSHIANGTSIGVTCGAPGCNTQSDWLATVRGRAGFAWDRVLFYGTGGAAFGEVQGSFGTLPYASATQTGWTAGAGVEWAFLPNWTAKVEYLYVNLGNFSCPPTSCGFGPAGGPSPNTSISFTENIIRAGINYKFGW
jgi:opacity protein-like surface antigen